VGLFLFPGHQRGTTDLYDRSNFTPM
jgi:hypothetical protein